MFKFAPVMMLSLLVIPTLSSNAHAATLEGAQTATVTTELKLMTWSAGTASPVGAIAYSKPYANGNNASCRLILTKVASQAPLFDMISSEPKQDGQFVTFAPTQALSLTAVKHSTSVDIGTLGCNGEPEFCSNDEYKTTVTNVSLIDQLSNQWTLSCASILIPAAQTAAVIDLSTVAIPGFSIQ